MNAEIQQLINAHLPAQVGDVLRKRLQQADETEALLKKANETIAKKDQEITSLHGRLGQLESIDRNIADINRREAELMRGEIRLAKETAVLDAQKSLINMMLDRNEKIVLAVFSNNKMKYREERQDGYVFPPNAQTSYPQTGAVPSSRTVETEG